MKLSVIVLTYNHIHFIRQALESVLTQKTDFDFEILIVEDCSTDGTRDVVIEFARKYPEKIRLLLSPVNICDNIIMMNAVEASRGEYIALLDGDDYWTSPYKLQKQSDFMEDHPELTLSWHECLDVDREGNLIHHSESPPVLRTCVDIRTMLQYPIRAVPMSVMFKRNAALPIPS